MTGPVKPPGGAPPPAAPDAPEGPRSGGFAERVAGATVPDPPARVGEGPSAVVQALLAELQAGTLDGAGAVDALVRRALESPAAAALTAEGRARLEAVLRDAVADDPHLSSLVRAVDRG